MQMVQFHQILIGTMSSNITQLVATVSTIRESIVNKDVPLAASDGFLVYPDAVRAINNQDFTQKLKPSTHGINYYDYNGTLLYVYTPQEFLALPSHPSQPTHTGLTADGWNWSLSDAQTFIRNTCDCLNIGALYITNDNWTRFYIDIPEEMEREYIEWRLSFRVTKKNGIQVDWGDGSAIERPSVNANTNTNTSNHRYYHAGKYCIRVLPDNDCIFQIANSSAYTNCVGYAYMYWRMHSVKLYKVEIGKNISLASKAFIYCSGLETISFPSTLGSTTIGGSFITNTTCILKGLVIPPNITTISDDAFTSTGNSVKCVCFNSKLQTCGYGGSTGFRVAESIILPTTLTSITQTFMSNSTSVKSLFIPDTFQGTCPCSFAAD